MLLGQQKAVKSAKKDAKSIKSTEYEERVKYFIAQCNKP
jgi:hypothetical protein